MRPIWAFSPSLSSTSSPICQSLKVSALIDPTSSVAILSPNCHSANVVSSFSCWRPPSSSLFTPILSKECCYNTVGPTQPYICLATNLESMLLNCGIVECDEEEVDYSFDESSDGWADCLFDGLDWIGSELVLLTNRGLRKEYINWMIYLLLLAFLNCRCFKSMITIFPK